MAQAPIPPRPKAVSSNTNPNERPAESEPVGSFEDLLKFDPKKVKAFRVVEQKPDPTQPPLTGLHARGTRPEVPLLPGRTQPKPWTEKDDAEHGKMLLATMRKNAGRTMS